MSPVVIPALAAANAAALLVECALNILVSIPALSNRDLSHLAKVDEHTGLCGLTTARNNLVCSSLPPVWKGSVLCSYARKVCCGQSLPLLGKAGKKTLLLAFPVWTVLPDLPPETLPLPECVCDIADLTLPDQQIWMVWSMPESWPVSR